MTEAEIVVYAQNFIRENGIKTASELQKKNNALSLALSRRGLTGKVGLEKAHIDWASLDDSELVSYAQGFVDENDIVNKRSLLRKNARLHDALVRRKLLELVGFRERRDVRAWSKYSNEELVEFARAYIGENGLESRFELQKTDKGRYRALLDRRLLGKVGFKADERAWRLYSNDRLLEFVHEFLMRNRIMSPNGLKESDPSLYNVLLRRKLINKVRFKKRKRQWAAMSDEELVTYIKKFIRKKKISTRRELEEADNSLYQTALRRRLIPSVFSPIEQSQSERAIEQIIDFTASFGEQR